MNFILYVYLSVVCLLGLPVANLFAQGSWTAPFATGVEAIHMTVLDTNRVFTFSYRETSPFPWGTFDPENPPGSTASGGTANFFCAGHTVLADGQFLMVDGTAGGALQRFNPVNETWSSAGNTATNQTRWYPSTIILGNGTVFTLGGTEDGGGPGCLDGDLSGEIYDPVANSSTLLNGGANLLTNQEANAYPRLFLMWENLGSDTFKVFNPGPFAQSEYYTINTSNNTATKTFGPVDPGALSSGCASGRIQATYARLDDGRVIAAGGFAINETGSTSAVTIIDPEAPSPSWSSVASMPQARYYIASTLLADGRFMVIGGTNGGSNYSAPLIYDPTANSWSNAANDSLVRNYHTTSILLPSGKVCMSGGEGNGGPGALGESDQMQVYTPDYLSAGARPVINSAPTTASYGSNINVTYTSSNPINDVILRRPGSSTHSFTYNMIGAPCSYTDNGSSLTVTIPSNPNRIPPGFYMLFIFSDNSGTKVPSVAKWIKIDGSGPPPDSNPPSQPSISGFSNVLDISLTVSSTLSTDAEGSTPIEYQFNETTGNTGGTDSGWQTSVNYSDTGLNASTQYCYQVRARDSQGNTTGYSTVSCTTTTAGPDTDPPTPNPMTFAVLPAAIGDAVITMTATTATDAQGSLPIEYQFDETSGNPGATDSAWQQSIVYYDYRLQGGTQYTYRVRARDGLGNIGSYSSSASATTAPEDGFTDISVGPGNFFDNANVTINVGDTIEWTFLGEGHNVWSGLSGAHNYLDSNPSQIAFSSTGDPTVTNPIGFTYSATFDQAFLDSSTGDAGFDQYNYHCHLHGSGIPFQMFGTITVNGGTPPPAPNPMTFASAPAATSCSSITMTATTATSANSPVEYLFTETTGGSGATDSNWQLSATYVDNGLAPSTQYTYNVRARDATGNAGTASTNASATTQSGGGGAWGSQVNNTDSSIAYSGMSNVPAQGGFQNDAHFTENAGSASFSINGDGLRIYVWRLIDVTQSFSVSIDGGSAQTVNVGLGSEDSFMAYEVTSLGSGSHNVALNWVSGEFHLDAYQVQAGGGSCGSDVAPPTPDPATFASAPAATSSSVIAMTATTGSDASGPVEYLFAESSGNAGGTSSSWQTSASYSDTGLTGGTEYTYSVQMRDSVGNTTAVSARFSATTTGGGDTTAPTPDPATFASAPSANSDTAISMTATAASDPSSPVEYNFDNVSGGAGGTDSGWQTSTSYTDLGLSASTQYCYTVQSRDSVGNTGTASAQSCATTQAPPDTTPPTPNPATFASAPAASSDTVISMTATTASDPSGPVEYNFDHVSGTPGGTDSGWQTSTSYTDSGLTASTQYCYTVQSRDSVGNTGTASAQSCATTQATPDTTPPTPNPATFASAPASTGTSSIAMTATTGSDPSGPVEYFFTETTANPGGSNSSWQTSTSYTDTLLSPSTQYCYTVTSRDSVGNTGSASAASCATTDALPDTTPPTPNPATFATAPSADSDTAISMTATTASDPSGPVEYNFDETTAGPGATDSGWQTSTSYTDSGLTASTQYCYTVQSRDSVGNTGTASSTSCATTNSGGGSCGSGQPYTNFVGAGQNQDVVATSSSVDETATASKTVDGSGLSGGAHDGVWNNALQAPSASANPNSARGTSFWVQYDLGHLYKLGAMQVWNHNEPGFTARGFNSVSIDYSQDGTNWTALGNFTFPQASGASGYTGFTGPDFGGICARYVIITSNTNYGDGFSHSLGEVQFNLVP